MLTVSELASMRATVNDSLASTAIIKSRTWVSDGGGGGTTTYVAGGTVNCRVAPIQSAEKYAGERMQPETECVFTFPWDTSVSVESLITHDGRDFAVTAVRAPRTWEVSRRIEAKEVK